MTEAIRNHVRDKNITLNVIREVLGVSNDESEIRNSAQDATRAIELASNAEKVRVNAEAYNEINFIINSCKAISLKKTI